MNIDWELLWIIGHGLWALVPGLSSPLALAGRARGNVRPCADGVPQMRSSMDQAGGVMLQYSTAAAGVTSAR